MHGSAVQTKPIPGSEQVATAASALGISEADLWRLLSQSDQIAYKVNEAAKLLDLSERTVWSLIRSDELESFLVGTARRVSRAALLDFVKRRQDQSPASA